MKTIKENALNSLKNKNFLEGLKILNLNKEDFEIQEGEFGVMRNNDLGYGGTELHIIDLNCECIVLDDILETEEIKTITYTLNDNIEDICNIDDMLNLKGYWNIAD